MKLKMVLIAAVAIGLFSAWVRAEDEDADELARRERRRTEEYQTLLRSIKANDVALYERIVTAEKRNDQAALTDLANLTTRHFSPNLQKMMRTRRCGG